MDWHKMHSVIRPGILALTGALLAACGSSGNDPGSGLAGTDSGAGCVPGDPSAAAACGTVVLALTDVEGEFTSYTVDVLSISLDKVGGGTVELLPQATRVDFAQLTALSELVSSSLIAPGDFAGGRIRLDYGNADIFVEAGGAIVPVAVYDSGNTLLTTDTAASIVEVDIVLPETNRLAVRRGTTVMLSIDFDLDASHLVDTASTPVQAIARPYLVAEVEPVDEKTLRVRGALAGVDLDADSYDIRLRPWYHRDGQFGTLTIHTTDATVFEIDGVGYTGEAGLEALAGLPAGSLSVAFGRLSTGDRRFTAEIVHAGDSVEGGRYAAVLGNIVARTGDRLVIRGGIAIRRDRPAHFQRTVVVDIGPDTIVTREGRPDLRLGADALSVGQRTLVFGEFAGPVLDRPDPFGPDIALVLDATEGRARLKLTRLTGSLVAATAGEIELKLRAIDRLGIELFNFVGTGGTLELDADPSAYQVATATLPIDTLVADRAVRVFGFVAPFGAAPPDFEGRIVLGPSELPATLGVGWGLDGTAAPFSALGADSLVIDLANPDIGTRHHLLIGYELTDLFDLPASPLIVESSAPRVYGITEPGHIELFQDFADFVDELTLRLSNTDRARSLAAYGNYAADDNTLGARKIVVHMLPAGTP